MTAKRGLFWYMDGELLCFPVSGAEVDTVGNPSLTTLSPWEKFCLTLMELEQRAAWEMVHIDG